jgi:hypothetical protein
MSAKGCLLCFSALISGTTAMLETWKSWNYNKYVGTGPANIFGERTPCKKLADLHPRQGNLLQRNNFSAVYKTSLHFAK